MGRADMLTKEFTFETVRLTKHSATGAEVARELGIPRNRPYKWVLHLEHCGETAFPRSEPPGSSATGNSSLRFGQCRRACTSAMGGMKPESGRRSERTTKAVRPTTRNECVGRVLFMATSSYYLLSLCSGVGRTDTLKGSRDVRMAGERGGVVRWTV